MISDISEKRPSILYFVRLLKRSGLSTIRTLTFEQYLPPLEPSPPKTAFHLQNPLLQHYLPSLEPPALTLLLLLLFFISLMEISDWHKGEAFNRRLNLNMKGTDQDSKIMGLKPIFSSGFNETHFYLGIIIKHNFIFIYSILSLLAWIFKGYIYAKHGSSQIITCYIQRT